MVTGMTRCAPILRGDVEVSAAGVQWDAVCVPDSLAELVLAALGADSGAVIHDPYNRLSYWLITPKAADHWRLPDEAHVRILGAGSWVGVPRREIVHAAPVYWKRPPGIGCRRRTPPHQLHAALQVAITEAVQP